MTMSISLWLRVGQELIVMNTNFILYIKKVYIQFGENIFDKASVIAKKDALSPYNESQNISYTKDTRLVEKETSWV